ncbi:methionine-tRNA ligase [Polytolypa hystricis UAMH7299]|uniref:Probable methionine--tRNA ligase, mitochondrial n=1 Tax=Polytolypa hystricis (strain UAMH7299) TaxID=1447883 RepID=A0A2B7YB90_POLH7|nr:methionine-tRNA ligase [Polytolypa hystricis UAMH7299]
MMLGAELSALLRASNPLRRPISRSWTCLPCRHANYRFQQRRGITTSTPGDHKKPYYVTTPIFYVNAAPHVGHLYTIVLADILKRWQLLLGNTDAKLLTGTDEHGMKIQQAAEAQGMTPQALCDTNCQTFKSLATACNASYDHFIRTTEETHKEAVRHFWEMLQHRGYIYTAKHEGWYSVSDETFYPASAVQPTLDPATGRKRITSIETGKEVEWSSEENYHFRLSAFQDRLLEYYDKNPDFIRPNTYMRQIVQVVSSGLQDLSISRPSTRLSWGIGVPGDETQTIYVWLDALVNYLTYAGYPFPPGQESRHIWPADVQVVGKDIIRFHCIYWPAFLMALDLPLPRNILAHAHWTINHAKMSKSTGNVVNPMFAIERFGIDGMRYFLARDGPMTNDSDYDNHFIAERYKKGLQWGLGNTTSRLLRPRRWKVGKCVSWATQGQLPEETDLDMEQREMLEDLPEQVQIEMDNLNPRKALDHIMGAVAQISKYFQATEPWNMADRVDPDQPSELGHVIFNIAESQRIAGILLQPFMPEKAARLLDMLGVARTTEKRSFKAATYGSDRDYGIPLIKLGRGVEGTLFPPLMTYD